MTSYTVQMTSYRDGVPQTMTFAGFDNIPAAIAHAKTGAMMPEGGYRWRVITETRANDGPVVAEGVGGLREGWTLDEQGRLVEVKPQ